MVDVPLLSGRQCQENWHHQPLPGLYSLGPHLCDCLHGFYALGSWIITYEDGGASLRDHWREGVEVSSEMYMRFAVLLQFQETQRKMNGFV